MKRITSLVLFICMIVIASLSSCGGGNIKNVQVKEVESKLYSSEDINLAINTIKHEFKKSWNGCTLKEIYYAGDEITKDHQDWADRNNADQVIVLLSTFDVDSSSGDGSLNPNSTYDGWNWILIRNSDGKWKHVDHGY